MRAAEQVPLLLQMKEDKIALVKAIDSGDTDLGAQISLERGELMSSIPSPVTSADHLVTRRLFPSAGRLCFTKPHPSHQATTSVCSTRRQTTTPRLLLPGR